MSLILIFKYKEQIICNFDNYIIFISNYIIEYIEKYPNFDNLVTTLGNKIKLDKRIIASILFISLIIYYELLLWKIAVYGYPIYASIQAINEKSIELITNWLIYWIVIGFYSIFYPFIECIFFGYLPFLFNLAIVVSLYHPSFSIARNFFDLLFPSILIISTASNISPSDTPQPSSTSSMSTGSSSSYQFVELDSPDSITNFISKLDEIKKMILNDITSTNESNLLINNFISFQNNLILDIINRQNNEIQNLNNHNQNDQVAINYYVKTEQIYQKLKKFKTVFDEFVCSICLDNITDHSLGPCGHLLCGRCSNLVTHCPLCRVQVTSKLKIILPVNEKYDENDFEIDDL